MYIYYWIYLITWKYVRIKKIKIIFELIVGCKVSTMSREIIITYLFSKN